MSSHQGPAAGSWRCEGPAHWMQLSQFQRDELAEQSINRMMTVIDLAHKIRQRHNKALKTPLKEMVVVHPDKEFLEDIMGKLKEYIMEEMNVKMVAVCNDPMMHAYLRAEPSISLLSKRLGTYTSKVLSEVKAMTQEQILAFQQTGEISFFGHCLKLDDIKVVREFKRHADVSEKEIDAAGDGDMLVILDLRGDQSLIKARQAAGSWSCEGPAHWMQLSQFQESPFNQDKLDELCASYDVPSDYVASTNWEPGAILVYEAALVAGMQLPIEPFISEILTHFKITPWQLIPQGWTIFSRFLRDCKEKGVKASKGSFLYFYKLRKREDFFSLCPVSHEKQEVRGICQKTNDDRQNSRKGSRHEKSDWKGRFFFLKSKSGVKWSFPIEERKGTFPALNKHLLTPVESKVVKALGGKPREADCVNPDGGKMRALASSPQESGNRDNEKKFSAVSVSESPLASSSHESVNCDDEKKLSAVTICNLESKFKVVKQAHLSLSLEAHSLSLEAHDFKNKMVGAFENLVTENKVLKTKYNAEMAKTRRLHNVVEEMKGNIRVFCRCRPLSQVETSSGYKYVVDFDGANDGELGIVKGEREKNVFKFDRVFTPKEDQVDVYADTSSLVTSTLDGYNVCIFAYGPTGSGKTFTLEGTERNRGIYYRTLEDLFKIAKEREDTMKYTITVSVIEIYNEQIRDLLAAPPSSKNLDIKLANDGSYLPDMIKAEADNISDAWNLLKTGSSSRSVGSNNVNEHSSRSHCMLCIMVGANNLINGDCTRSKLWLVDLAGSERLDKTGAQGDRLTEAKHISSSLSCLGDVISALATRNNHIPYRNSKLTRLLQDSLGGGSKVLMFVNISPSDNDASETWSALNLASRARGVDLGPAKKRVDMAEYKKVKHELERLKLEVRCKDDILNNLKSQIKDLQSKLVSKPKEHEHPAILSRSMFSPNSRVKNNQGHDKIKDLESSLVSKPKEHERPRILSHSLFTPSSRVKSNQGHDKNIGRVHQ